MLNTIAFYAMVHLNITLGIVILSFAIIGIVASFTKIG